MRTRGQCFGDRRTCKVALARSHLPLTARRLRRDIPMAMCSFGTSGQRRCGRGICHKMVNMQPKTHSNGGRVPRRIFLADLGLGFIGLSLAAMLHRDGHVKADEAATHSPPDGRPHHAPRAKSVIWIFLSGGYSHVETFDPKPALNRYAGMTFDQTPYANPLRSPLHDLRSRSVVAEEINVRDRYPIIYPMQVGWQRHGQSGIEVTDWWPHLAACVDDIAFVRNVYTTDNDHAAENQIHTGRHRLDEVQPSIGAWAHYGLGTLNENLPQFVVLGGPTSPVTRDSVGPAYLGPRHNGVPLNLDP